ncbi:MAG: PLD nuclease N-terminal domain-containing protein [Bacteroidota bacterium]
MFIVLLLLSVLLWLWALVDILQSTFKDSVSKISWLLVVVFIPLLGSILYLAIGRGQKVKSGS